nr:hypothetical protein CFP56_38718 [Quercus suber]
MDGIFGLGPSDASFISQLSSHGIAPKVFSHCLKLAIDSKKQKLNDKKGDIVVPPPIQTIPSSSTPSLKVTVFTPPTIRSKGKGKAGKSIWEYPVTALRLAHNAVTDDKLKGLAFVPSHELVSLHIHKSAQVLRESLRLTTDYLSTKEKVVVTNSKLESIEAKSLKLRKNLIVAMDETNKEKEKIKELKEALQVEKMLNLDFETVDIEILANEAKEQEEVAAIGGTDAAVTEGMDLGQRDETVAPST